MALARSLATTLMVLMFTGSSSATSQAENCVNNEAACDTKDTSMLSVRTLSGSHQAAQQEPKSITEIFEGVDTDKLYRHGYHRYYETHLNPYRAVDGLRLLEIGADSGISLGAWLKYFANPATVQGVAYHVDVESAKETACKLMPEQCEKLAIYNLDQSDKAALANMMAQNPEGWDIIIDDGSHYPGHQIISFQQLWPKIRPGGLYVIEDIETSYADFGNAYQYPLSAGIGKSPPYNAVEQFKRLADVVSRKHFGQPEFTVFGGVDKDVAEVDFADGLIFVQKKPANPDWDKYPQDTFIGSDKSGKSFNEYQQKLQAEHLDEKLKADPNNKN